MKNNLNLKNFKAAQKFDDLIEVLKTLLGPEGCDWDRTQTSDIALFMPPEFS